MEEENVIIEDEQITPDIQDEVITSQNIYQQAAANKVDTPVGEANHAADIVLNRDNFNHKAPIDQSATPTVETSTVAKGNVSVEPAIWESRYKMDGKYKADDSQDYSWNKIAEQRAQYTYLQEEAQVLAEYAKSKAQLDKAANEAMDIFFGSKYATAQTDDKMGWSGGSELSNERKMEFLRASTAAGMFTQQELQKYGIDSQLSVARLHAEAQRDALALEIFQDEWSRAVDEGNITGYFIRPELGEMMKQQEVARNILNNSNSSQSEKARAQRVISGANKVFDSMGFQKDSKGNYIGVETLQNLEFKETQRANQVSEKLQKQANDIAASNAAAAWAGVSLQQRQVEQTENMALMMSKLASSGKLKTSNSINFKEEGKVLTAEQQQEYALFASVFNSRIPKDTNYKDLDKLLRESNIQVPSPTEYFKNKK